MRIAFLTHQWPGTRLGGIGAYTLHAARGLARAGHEVHVFTLTLPADARAAAKLPDSVHVHEVAGLGQRVMDGTIPSGFGVAVQAGGDALHRLALASLLCEEALRIHQQTPLDLVEGPEYESLALPLAGVAVFPVVTQLHSGSAIAREVGNLPVSREQSLRELLELAAIEGADALCAPSRQVIADTRRAYARDDIATHVAVLPLPFDAATIPYTPPPAAGPVLYVGRIEHLKGSHLLAQAANIFLLRHRAATVRLAGPDTMTAPEPAGTSMADWMRRQLLPEVRDRVVFLGEQTRQQITAELAACAFFVAPSLRESYSYVCCEALAAGRPAVVSDQTGAAEVVGDAGIVFPRGNVEALAAAMSSLWENPAERERLARRAHARARDALSGNAVIARRVAFYEEVARDFRAPANAAPSAAATASERAAAQRLDKVEKIDWIRSVLAALRTRDAAALMDLVTQWGAVKTPGMRVVEALARHQSSRGTRAGVAFYLYGAGRHTAKLLAEKSLWESHGHRLAGLIDDHPRFKETPEAFGLPVESCAAAAARLEAGDAVILSTDAFEDQFWQQALPLRERGVGVWRLYGIQAEANAQ